MNQSKVIPLADLRSAEILASARLAFAAKGFDCASMQDLARMAGMSVGNFYRYFPSKSAIVEALIAADMARMEADFAAILQQPDPIAALRLVLRHRVTDAACGRDGELWAEITAAARRKPEIAAAAARMEEGIVGHLTTVFAHATHAAPADAAARWTAHARLVVMMVQACAMRAPGDASDKGDLAHLLLRTIDTVLADITPPAAKG